MSNYNPSDLFATIFLSSFFVIYLIIFIVMLLFVIALCAFAIICNWKLLEKAGEPGWKSLIPFYNIYTINDIAFTRPTSIVFFIIFCVTYVFICIPYLGAFIFAMVVGVIAAFTGYAVAKSFGRDTGMCVCAIFFSPIVFAILAFSKDIVYTGDKLTVFPESTNNN